MTPQERVAAARESLLVARKELTEALAANRTRARAPFVRMLHEVQGMLHPAFPYASQAGQDQIVDRIMRGKTGETFVDVGAYDGVTGSNSLYFEKWRGWTGLLIEPVPALREKAQDVRMAPCLSFAIAAEQGLASFMTVNEGFTQMSGLTQTYDPDLLARVRANPRHEEMEIKVETQTLSAVLSQAGLDHPDFVSLDIEGGEIAVMQDFPFSNHRVGAWAIENNAASPDLAAIMGANGYNLIEFCGPDEIYALANIE